MAKLEEGKLTNTFATPGISARFRQASGVFDYSDVSTA
jgi:hypothetical protein